MYPLAAHIRAAALFGRAFSIMKEEKRIRKFFASFFELPSEIVLNLPLITLVGKDELNIENYKGIIEYSDVKIRVKTTCGILKIEGRALTIKQLTNENLVIRGHITELLYI